MSKSNDGVIGECEHGIDWHDSCNKCKREMKKLYNNDLDLRLFAISGFSLAALVGIVLGFLFFWKRLFERKNNWWD